MAVPVGIVAGLGAAAFYYLITVVSAFFLGTLAGLTLPAEGTLDPSLLTWSSSFPRLLVLPAILVLGGLVVGIVSWRFAPEIAGHGTDAAIRAFHRQGGRVRWRVPLLKTLASALTLGTGGSGGREGPVAQIGAGFGSLWARVFGLDERGRRVALATGMGAGIGAIFRAPLGGAVYSAEILYTGDFEPDVFVPAIISSVVAYSIYSSIFGFQNLFATPPSLAAYAFDPERLPLYAVLGIACGGVGIFFVLLYRRTETWFARSTIPWALKPAVGAALASVIIVVAYLALPQQGHFAGLSTLGVGYGFVQAAMLGQLAQGAFTAPIIIVLLAAAFLRMETTSLVVGSGGSAGLFGTSVVVGALLGTTVGGMFHSLVPSLVPLSVVAVFSIVGMMSFFGGISKAPLGVLIMVVEMVGSYTVLPAAMVSIFVAYVLTGRTHIYIEQLPSRLQSPAHLNEYRSYLLAETPIAEIARQDSEPIPPRMSVHDAAELAVARGRAVLSVEEHGSWFGAVRLRELLDFPRERQKTTPVAELARPVELLLPGDLKAEEALLRLDREGVTMAAVLATEGPSRVLGVVTARAIRNPGLSGARSQN